MGVPALGPDLGKERLEVTNGEEDVALETETGTGENGMAKVPGDGGEGILLHHAANGLELLGGGLLVDLGDKLEALEQGQVGPVDAVGGIRIVGTGDMAKDAALLGAGADSKLVAVVAAGGSMGDGNFTGNNVIAVVMVVMLLVVLVLIGLNVLALGLGIDAGPVGSHDGRWAVALASLASRSDVPVDVRPR